MRARAGHGRPAPSGQGVSRFAARLQDARRAFAANARNPALRRAQLTFGYAFAAEWAVTVALGVVAYHAGGASAVGLVGFLRTIPAAALGPLGGVVSDRFRRDRVLAGIGLVRTAAIGGAAALLVAGAPVGFVYALAVVQTIAFTLVRPTHSALLPALCRTPRELVSANVVRGSLDSLSLLVGPLLAAVLLGVSAPAGVFVAAAVLSAASAAVVLRVVYEPLPGEHHRTRLLADAAEGALALARNARVRLLTTLGATQTLTRGALSVLVVVFSIELLGTGNAGVGVLTAAVGAGAVLGSLGVSLLASGRRLGALLGAGVALWGLPLAIAALLPYRGPVLVLLAVIGFANALVDVGLFTLFARLVPDHLLGRVLTVDESLLTLGVAVGAIVAPAAVDLLGTRGAAAAIGLLGPIAAVLAWRALRRIDAAIDVRDEEIAALQRVDVLGPLPVPAIEHLAEHVSRLEVDPPAAVVTEGEVGDRLYVIVEGEAEVLRAGKRVRAMRAGECFGEIALLRDVPRTATVRALTPLRLFALERRHFVPTVSGYRASVTEAEALVSRRLASDAAAAGPPRERPAAP